MDKYEFPPSRYALNPGHAHLFCLSQPFASAVEKSGVVAGLPAIHPAFFDKGQINTLTFPPCGEPAR